MAIMRRNESKPTILIVDDITTNLVILSDLLKDDYIIKVAKNGQKGLELAQTNPDLILLDIEMPEMDGYEVCKNLKNNPITNNIPIIFVTARNNVQDEEYGLNLGAVDYISKPFHPTIVKIRVKNHIILKLKSDLLEELSMLDGLTHIPNRRYFNTVYDEKYKETIRDGKTLAIIMIDVDYFKLYNDHYGHGLGDECLIKIAGALKNSLKRPSDMIARYGGEEFVVVLKDIDHEGAQKVADSLVEAVESLKITHKYSLITNHVTISLGIALKEKESTLSQESLLKNADNALYRAKESGRNRGYFI